MKNKIKNLVVEIMSSQSRKILAKHKPYVIAITGNVGKTTTKDYIYNFLEYKFKEKVRASEKSQNSEFGLNLTILGEKNAWNSFFGWSKIILKGYLKTFLIRKYPEVLVLEVGADKPGDIQFITSIIKPDMVVLTAFQPSPTHGEFFLNIDQHILEKRYLVDALKTGGKIIYNADDEVMTKMVHYKKQQDQSVQLLSFGTKENSDMQILETSNLYTEDADILGLKTRFLFKNDAGAIQNLDFRLTGVLGQAQIYSLAAAILVSKIQGFEKQDLENAMQNINQKFLFAKSRMTILDGLNNSKIIDDSYNASPKAAVNGVESIANILCKGKKIAILGHMAELGKKTREEHFAIGYLAAQNFNLIILSGKHNEYYLEGIREVKFNLEKVFLCENAQDVIDVISDNKIINQCDIVFVKGSQSARLEKVVVEILNNKNDAEKVCRQDVEWFKR